MLFRPNDSIDFIHCNKVLNENDKIKTYKKPEVTAMRRVIL